MADYSITAVTRRVVYTGSAGVGPYAFTFPVISQTDIAVYKNSTKLTLTTNYTVTINGANGTGSVTLVSAATGSDRITIIGARAIERTTDFVTAGDLKASSLNEQLDASIILIQQLAEENKRTLKAPQFDPAAVEDGGTLSMVLPTSTSRAGKTLAFDTDGNPVVGEDIGNWRGNWAAGVSYTVRDLVKDGSNSNVYRVNTAHTSSGTTPISSNADVAKFDLVIDAVAADASADAAAASASAAATSASNASTSASNASTSASNASTSASNASSAQTAAESARDATLAAYDSFDDRYLGSKTSDPTLDNDGNALVGGALYFNSIAGEMRIWTGSAWVAAYVSSSGFVSQTSLTGAAQLPSSTTANRPTPVTGQIRFNTTLSKFEGYNASAWINISDMVSVKEYGAIGNGVANDAPAIQAAINAAQALGRGGIYLPSGNYKINSGILITGDNITLYGDGIFASTIFSTTNNFSLITFQSCSKCGMENIGIYRNQFTSVTTDFCINLDNAVQFSARRLFVQGSYYNVGITGNSSADYTFQECIFLYATGPAMIYMVRSSAGVSGAYHFYRCIFNQPYPAGAPVPANSKSTRANSTAYVLKDVIIVGSYYYQCTTAGTSDSSLPAAYGTVWYGTSITDGTAIFKLMCQTTYNGLRVDTGIYYVTLRECDLTFCGPYAIRIMNSLAGTKPNNIHVEQCTIHGPHNGGIYIQSGEEIDLRAIECWNPTATGTQYGILIGTDGVNINISDANIHGIKGDGVLIGGEGVSVNNSMITGNTAGIRVSANIGKFRIIGNELGNVTTGRWGANTNAVVVSVGTSNNYIISQNVVAGATSGVTDGGTGVSKSVTANV